MLPSPQPTDTLAASPPPSTTTLSDSFDILEQKFLAPTDINHRFDLWLDPIRRVSSEEKIFFTQNIGVMLKSGLAMARALRTITLQTQNAKFKRIMFQITRAVEKGGTLADALSAHPNVFEPIFINMIRAGEKSGQLEQVLEELTHQLKRSHELIQKIRGALMYPAAVLISMVAIGAGMIVFVIPKLLAVFTEMNVELPLPTRILIAVSNFVNGNMLIVAPLVVAAAGALVYFTRRGPGQHIWHAAILYMPVVKTISRKINLAKMSRTLASLLKTDMPIVESFSLTANIVNNVLYRDSLIAIGQKLERGQAIAKELEQYDSLYPPVVRQMVEVGEETGELDNILSELAQFYEDDVSQTMNSLPSLIEPILIVVLGGAVGAMAVAIIMPMYSLSSSI